MTIGGIIFNFIGACVRWTYGTIWRSIANKPKFTFKEYLYGLKEGDFIIDGIGHEFNNKMIGIAFLVLIAILLLKYG